MVKSVAGRRQMVDLEVLAYIVFPVKNGDVTHLALELLSAVTLFVGFGLGSFR